MLDGDGLFEYGVSHARELVQKGHDVVLYRSFSAPHFHVPVLFFWVWIQLLRTTRVRTFQVFSSLFLFITLEWMGLESSDCKIPFWNFNGVPENSDFRKTSRTRRELARKTLKSLCLTISKLTLANTENSLVAGFVVSGCSEPCRALMSGVVSAHQPRTLVDWFFSALC